MEKKETIYEFIVTDNSNIETKTFIPCKDGLEAIKIKELTLKSNGVINVEFKKIMETKSVEKLDYSFWRKKNTVMLIKGGWFGNQTPCYVGDAQPKTEKEWKELYEQSIDKKAVQCEPCAIEITKEEPKQETKQETTLEEASKNYLDILSIENLQLAFTNGAKWQQERSYSEEEVIELLQKALTYQDDEEIGSLVTAQREIRTANFYSWFEQFKNK